MRVGTKVLDVECDIVRASERAPRGTARRTRVRSRGGHCQRWGQALGPDRIGIEVFDIGALHVRDLQEQPVAFDVWGFAFLWNDFKPQGQSGHYSSAGPSDVEVASPKN